MEILQNIYKNEINHLSAEIETIKRIDRLNSKLREYNWIFMHPYNQGFEVTFFEKLIENSEPEDVEQKLYNSFARKFLDLKLTISMLDGYYRKRPFLCDFSQQIEESIILCLQKDFSGAIHLLIPVIEGSIRNYMIYKKGDTAKHMISMSDLTKAFKYLEDDYATIHKEYLQSNDCHLTRHSGLRFNDNQIENILKKHREYFSLWMKQLEDYLKRNLYLNTRNVEKFKDSFNRHNIFHGFEQPDYNFKNYLKLISCINFLSWAYGITHKGCSIFAEVDDEKVREKWVEYYKILIISESMTSVKSSIYGYRIDSFMEFVDDSLKKPLLLSETIHKTLLDINNRYKNSK